MTVENRQANASSGHRVRWLELFYDLTVVALVVSILVGVIVYLMKEPLSPMSFTHLQERFGLLVLILMGGAMVEMADGFAEDLEVHDNACC